MTVVAYFVQDKFIFKPEKLPADFKFSYDAPFEELFFDIEPGVRINGLHFYVKIHWDLFSIFTATAGASKDGPNMPETFTGMGTTWCWWITAGLAKARESAAKQRCLVICSLFIKGLHNNTTSIIYWYTEGASAAVSLQK